ncbi:TPA: hypothetical protein N0F65_004823 [Lagenidium giganteum]|uniref:Reverse transcriptase n=1 Tax=Lagenidium giganteum TaxID=4803 RepID=A0AAV2Z4A6_9STRA|nr:TPA: hypothetical protein N0F65_004823 [Lagenidium giganteum]
MVIKTHNATIAAFKVNDLLAKPLNVTRGIRQGCPEHSLYHRVESLPSCVGSVGGRHQVPSHSKLLAVPTTRASTYPTTTRRFTIDRLIVDFAKASGLAANVHKTIVCPRGSQQAVTIGSQHCLSQVI